MKGDRLVALNFALRITNCELNIQPRSRIQHIRVAHSVFLGYILNCHSELAPLSFRACEESPSSIYRDKKQGDSSSFRSSE